MRLQPESFTQPPGSSPGGGSANRGHHRRRCSATLRSNTGDGLIIGRRLLISTSAATRLRHPHRCSHAAVITSERLMPATQWINRVPCRTPCDIASMTASNFRAEIGRDSNMGIRVYLIWLALYGTLREQRERTAVMPNGFSAASCAASLRLPRYNLSQILVMPMSIVSWGIG